MKNKLFIIVMLAAVLSANAQTMYHNIESHKVGALYYQTLTDSTVEVLVNQDLCEMYPRHVVVPAKVMIDGNEYTVVRIGDGAFANSCGTFESITLPETIVEIGREAFVGFSNSVVLPESLKRIEWGAFALHQADTFRIPRNVEYIAEDAFSGDKIWRFEVDRANRHYVVVDSLALCNIDTTLLLAYPGMDNDTAYAVPGGVRRIAGSAFYGNVMLRRVTLPEGLLEIGSVAFGRNLRGLHIPASVCRIDGTLRDTVSSRFELTVDPSSRHYKVEDGMLLSYNGDTLVQELGLAGVLHVPAGVRVVGENAFYLNDRLTKVVLPEGVTDIKYMAFGFVTAEVNLPLTLRTIGDYAFANTTKVKSISIPSVRTIGKYAFLNSSIERVDSAFSLQTVGCHAFEATPLRSMYIGDSLRLIGEYGFASTNLSGDIVFRSHIQGVGMFAFAVGGMDRATVTFDKAVDTLGHRSVRCKVVRFKDVQAPKAGYGRPFWKSDTVYTPCGHIDDFMRAVPHDYSPLFVEWCEEAVESPEKGMEVRVYPNPSNGDVTLVGLPEGVSYVAVRDMVGREVMRKVTMSGTQVLTFSVADLPAGTYFVTLTTKEGTSTRKLVVE